MYKISNVPVFAPAFAFAFLSSDYYYPNFKMTSFKNYSEELDSYFYSITVKDILNTFYYCINSFVIGNAADAFDKNCLLCYSNLSTI